jgi:riboflavin kinase / FMN adenylyltransferase
VTLGNFDGVHWGHRAILDRVVTEARAAHRDAVAITFHPHPVAVLRPDQAPELLTSIHEKMRRLAARGVDVVVLQHFTRAFAALTAEEFVERLLVGRLRVARLIVGHSVSFGHERRGNATLLQTLGARFGFGVEVVGPVRVDRQEVSSSLVRRAVAAGNMPLATALLGHPHTLDGRVVVGKRRGAALGFPTANVHTGTVLHPPDGVYAVRVAIDDCRAQRDAVTTVALDGVANIGRNPTFGENARTLEAYLFDFAGDLYRRRVRVAFIERLREEVAFAGVDALVEQIRRDVDDARAALARHASVSAR